jgi:hypothetical protein
MYEAPTSAVHQKEAWARVPHTQARDSSNWAMCLGTLLPYLVRGGLVELPWGPPKPPNVAQA